MAEDDENDAYFLKRAFLQAGINAPIEFVQNGEKAVAYLTGRGDGERESLPKLMLLDLKMPGMSGIEFLQWLRQQPGYGSTRVVILTSSSLTRDVNAAYQAGANSFLIKPVDFERFVEITSALSGYWMRTDVAPETQRPFTQSSVEQKKR